MDLKIKDISLRDIQENDLPILCEIYGSTRTEELEKGTDWSAEQKKIFIEHQFSAQHEYYQKNYIGAKFYIIEKENNVVGRLYIDFFFEKKVSVLSTLLYCLIGEKKILEVQFWQQ